MALRAVAMRLRGGAITRRLQQSRAFSNDGRVLSEEERAAENMYIKKVEKEKLEKAKQQLHEQPSEQGSTSESSGSSPIPGPSTDSSKNLAVFAGVAGILAAGWWFIRSGSKEEEKN